MFFLFLHKFIIFCNVSYSHILKLFCSLFGFFGTSTERLTTQHLMTKCIRTNLRKKHITSFPALLDVLSVKFLLILILQRQRFLFAKNSFREKHIFKHSSLFATTRNKNPFCTIPSHLLICVTSRNMMPI